MKTRQNTIMAAIPVKCILLVVPVIFLVGLLFVGCDGEPALTRKDVPNDSVKTLSLETDASDKVLLVHSYHEGYPWADAITRGVRMALSEANVDLQVYYMDTKRRTDMAWKQQAGEAAREVVEDWQPAIVIAADDNAQEYCAQYYAGLSQPQVVFCGVNDELEKYGYPAPNVTGILEKPHLADSLGLIQKLCPDATRVAIVTDDSPTSAGALRFMKSPPPPFEIVAIETPSTFADWKEAIERVKEPADLIATYMYHTVKRTSQVDSESVDPKEVMEWTSQHSRLPLIGFFIFAVDDGALCGQMESGVEHGFKAGTISRQILQGQSANSIPLVTALEGQSMLNLDTAARLGITVPQSVIDGTDVVIGR